jgi:hypothetical protein
MRQFRTSGSVRGAAREGGPYRDRFKVFKTFKSFKRCKAIGRVLPISFYGKLKQLAKMKGTGL